MFSVLTSVLGVSGFVALCLGFSEPVFAKEFMVHIAHDHVDPETIAIKVGDVVSFHNHSHDHPAHVVVSDDGSFRSPSLAGGDYWDHRFEKTGTYTYRVENHQNATGKIVVK